GTLTTNRLRLEGIDRLDFDTLEEAIRARIGAFASASVDKNNKNIQAIEASLGQSAALLLEQIPFKSQNRYSAVRVRVGSEEHVLVLGSVEALLERVLAWEVERPGNRATEKLTERALSLEKNGLRLLLLAEAGLDVLLAEQTAL